MAGTLVAQPSVTEYSFMSMPPSGDQPAYVDPVTGQPLFIDPTTGQLAYSDPAAPAVDPAQPPGYPPTSPYQPAPGYGVPGYPTTAGYPGPPPPGYPAPGSPTSGYPAPGYPTSGYPTSGYPAPGSPPPGYPATMPYPTGPVGGYPSGYSGAMFPGSAPPDSAMPGSAFPTSGHFPNATDTPAGYPFGDPNAVPYTGFTTPAFTPGAYGFGMPLQRRTNPLAITGMILSIVGAPLLFCDLFGGLLALAGAILGHVARHQIKQRGEDGSGMALAAIIVGWIVEAIALAGVILIIWFATHLNSFDDTTY